MNRSSFFRFPQGDELNTLLNLDSPVHLEDLFQQTLTHPVSSLFDRPKKNIRGQLVDLGFRIAANFDEPLSDQSCQILEMLHAGSLVVDDIEDSSLERRGQPSLHIVYGVPVALNAGNWLYFLPFTQIDRLPVSEKARIRLLRECSRTLLLAHYGQALDVGVRVDSLPQSRVHEVAMSAIELKTGVLAGFALKIGGLLNEVSDEDLRSVEFWGRKLGISLQMFDDIGNLRSSHNPRKRAEDLKLGRLCFVAAVAARELNPVDYTQFLTLGKNLPGHEDEVEQWLEERQVIMLARKSAQKHLDESIEGLTRNLQLGSDEQKLLLALREKLMGSYD